MDDFRELTNREHNILEAMIKTKFPGHAEVELQIENCKARMLDLGDNYGSIEFSVKDAPFAPVTQRVPVELRAYDNDGVPIDALLHVENGVIDNLEILKADGSSIIKQPDPEQFKLEHRR